MNIKDIYNYYLLLHIIIYNTLWRCIWTHLALYYITLSIFVIWHMSHKIFMLFAIDVTFCIFVICHKYTFYNLEISHNTNSLYWYMTIDNIPKRLIDVMSLCIFCYLLYLLYAMLLLFAIYNIIQYSISSYILPRISLYQDL